VAAGYYSTGSAPALPALAAANASLAAVAETLSTDVKALTAGNHRLSSENADLKDRMAAMQNEVLVLLKASVGKSDSRTEELYDQVVEGGVVIIDDYGSFEGCRRATKEFFAMRRIKSHLMYVENSIRYIVKPATIFS
jgi:regulator of replication initiation timing